MSTLAPLFAPRSIAVVGASPSPEKAGYQMLASLAAFPGKLVPINPKAPEVLGHRAYPDFGAVGAPVDLAVLAIPAAACIAALTDAAKHGCRAAFIVSGGFGEAGDAGVRLQTELAAVARAHGVRLLGPNTSGFMNAHARCTANFAPGVDALASGPVAVVAQSGGVNLTLAFQLHRIGMGISLSVGLGNMVDVDAADCLDYLATDPHTRAVALHLEGVSYGRKLFDVLTRLTPTKPVAVLAVGRADIGEFAQSHTGALIGSYRRKIAALRQAGAVVVDTTDDLADAAAALACGRITPKRVPGIGLVTGQAGPGLIIADRLKSAGVAVPELTPASIARVSELLPPLTFMKNPVDTGRPPPTFPEVLKTVAADPGIDALVMFTLHEPAAVDPLAALAGVRAASSKPLVFGTMGTPALIGPTLAKLREAGIAAFESPDRAALAARVWAEDAKAAARLRDAQSAAGLTDTQSASRRHPSDASALPAKLDEAAAKDLLARYGIATPQRIACDTRSAAQGALGKLGGRIVAKILSSEIAHKTEVGGVVLGIDSAAKLDAALDRLDAIALTGPRRYLLEAMAAPGLELIVGGVNDPSFGPTLAVGLGGVTAEVLDDIAVRLAPLDLADAHEMLDELRGRALLSGWRGAPAIDRDALARLIVSLGALMIDHPNVAEIDLNPVRAYPDGAIALDALVVIGE